MKRFRNSEEQERVRIKVNKWKKYHWRVIGFALSGAGAGLMIDELIAGPFMLTPTNHEFWGLIMVIAGCVCISRKPKGKGE